MVFIPGNKRLLYWGKQSAKGTLQTTPTLCIRVEDFTPNDVRQKIQLEETDALTQDGESVVVGITPGFSFKAYLRPSEWDLLGELLLGVNADSGTNPNYTHTQSPAQDNAYATVYEREPSVLCNQYGDVRITQAVVTGGAGQALEVTMQCEALQFAAGATAPTTPAPASELPFTYPEVTVTKGGVAGGLVDQFEVTINRNGQRIQGDNGYTSLDYVNGKLQVSGSITKYQDSALDQRAVDTGSTSGTAPTGTIFSEALTIRAQRNANLSTLFTFTEVEYVTRQAGVRTDGSPIVEVLAFRTPPQATLAANVTVTTKNSKATPST